MERSSRLRHDVPEYAEEVADRPCENEQVPDRVVVGHAVPEVEQAAARVQSAAEREPHRAETAQAAEKVKQLLADALPDEAEAVFQFTEGPGHAIELAAQMGDADTVIALGGDGVIHLFPDFLDGLKAGELQFDRCFRSVCAETFLYHE